MRHRKNFNQLGRKTAHRKAMLANMAISLIKHKKIETTVAKAKALRTFVEPLITKSKEDTTHSRRVVFSELQSKEAVTELFRDVALKVADRPGGYTRILKTGNRPGDNADMCIIELVDYNENMLGTKDSKAKATRKRRSKKKKDDAVDSTVKKAPEKSLSEEVKAEPKNNLMETSEEESEENVQEATDAHEEDVKGEAEATDTGDLPEEEKKDE